jgi:3-dehydro-L-gulonate 2-dehydrogenase
VRLAYSDIEPVLKSVLLRNGFSADDASLCARLFAETTLDGVYSHGLNRFPLFIDAVQRGVVIPDSEPTLVRALNNFECWDGNLGPGNLNAWFCMGRAVDLAKEHGTATVSLRNTNHWMRAGTYGIQAAAENCIGICMTNTTPNMPPWGSRDSTVGNNVTRRSATIRLPLPFRTSRIPSSWTWRCPSFPTGKWKSSSSVEKNFPAPAALIKSCS